MSSWLAIDFRNAAWPKPWVSALLAGFFIITAWVVSLLAFGFSLPLFAIAMAGAGVAVFLQPTTGLPLIIIATMMYERWFTLQPIIFGDQVYKLYPLDIIFVATVAGFVFHQAFGKQKRRLKFSSIDIWLMAFIVLCLAYTAISIINASADPSLTISAFKNYAFYAFLFWLVGITVQDGNDLVLAMRTFLIGGMGVLIFVLIGLARGQGLWTEYTPLSTEGVRLLAFPHAFFLCLALIIGLVLLVYRLRPERTSLFIMWAQLVGVVGSLMRHLWGSLAAVAFIVWVVLPKVARKNLFRFFAKNGAVVALLAVLLIFITTVFPLSDLSLQIDEWTAPLYSRARSLANSAADSSARWRIYAWAAAKESFVAHPVVGIGYGQELTVDFETYRRVVPIRELHNSYLVLLVQMGLVGAFVFAGLLFSLARDVYPAWKGKGLLWPYQLAFLSALGIFLFASLWQPYFETNLTGIFFWILLGLVVASLRLEITEPHSR